jgi:type II secretory pathway pseudopilin PulG
MTQLKKANHQSGFTLVELSMALIFIAFIIIFLIATMLNVLATYNKGIWMNQMNAAVRQIDTDLSDQIRFSSSVVFVPANNRLCAGGVSYIWNTTDNFKNRFSSEAEDAVINKTSQLRLVRIIDVGGNFCNRVADMPNRDDSTLSALLGNNIDILRFDVASGADLIKFRVVLSTTGNNQPAEIDGRYQCGDWIGDMFQPSANQYCSFVDVNFVTYKRRAM